MRINGVDLPISLEELNKFFPGSLFKILFENCEKNESQESLQVEFPFLNGSSEGERIMEVIKFRIERGYYQLPCLAEGVRFRSWFELDNVLEFLLFDEHEWAYVEDDSGDDSESDEEYDDRLAEIYQEQDDGYNDRLAKIYQEQDAREAHIPFECDSLEHYMDD